MTQAKHHTLPLLFSFKHVVLGNGFAAGVQMDGHALLETDPTDHGHEVWITGIAPVGIAGGGPDRGCAFVEFRKAWAEVVFDLAAAARDFEDFRAACTAFFSSKQASMTVRWQDAVAEVRRSGYSDPALPTGSAEKQVAFQAVDLTHLLRATDNRVENGLQMAA